MYKVVVVFQDFMLQYIGGWMQYPLLLYCHHIPSKRIRPSLAAHIFIVLHI
jgi:hypothetical protein